MKFLSDEWIDTAHVRLQSNERFVKLSRHARLRLTIVAEPAPDWARSVTIGITQGKIELHRDIEGRSGAIGRASYDTWKAMLRHELHPRRAAFTRRLRGKGLPIILANFVLIDAALDVFREIEIDD